MKATAILAAAILGLVGNLQAEIRTYQGSTRWSTQLFTPGVNTGRAATNYTTYYLVEFSGAAIVNCLKIDAWTRKNSYGQVSKNYYEDSSFLMAYSFYGARGTEIAGAITSNSHSGILPFKGSVSYRELGAFSLIATTDYYKKDGNLDISTITGGARMNYAFSGYSMTMEQARNAVVRYLGAHGYYPIGTNP